MFPSATTVMTPFALVVMEATYFEVRLSDSQPLSGGALRYALGGYASAAAETRKG